MLAVYFTVVAIVYAGKLIGSQQRAGHSHADIGLPGTVQFVSHSMFRVFRLAVWAICVARAIDPTVDPWLMPFPEIAVRPVVALGLALLLVSLGWISYVHAFMGDAWRSGVGRVAGAQPLTTGPFALSRHPIFLGIIVGQVGFFLALPSLFSLLCACLGIAAVTAQAAMEERHSQRRFGAAYAAYMVQTPRWLWFGQRRRRPAEGQAPVGLTAMGQSSRDPHSAQEPS
jgi:protein-S-isoprenylcysteine O-methyltransferase Ste14